MALPAIFRVKLTSAVLHWRHGDKLFRGPAPSVLASLMPRAASTDVIMTYTGLSHDKAEKYVKSPILKNLSNERVKEIAEVLKRFQMSEDCMAKNPRILLENPVVLANRCEVLRSYGYTPETVQKYMSRYGFGKPQPVQRLLDCASEALSRVPEMSQELSEQLFMELNKHLSKQDSLHTLLKKLVTVYLSQRLNINMDRIYKFFKSYDTARHTLLPLPSIARTLDILIKDIGFTEDQLTAKNKTLLLIYTKPENIMKLLNELPSLGGVPIRQVILRYPHILHNKSSTIMQIVQVLKKYDIDIPQCQIYNSLRLCAKKPEEVDRCLAEFMQIPELSALRYHPRLMFLVVWSTRVKRRLEILRNSNLSMYSLNLLIIQDHNFKRILESHRYHPTSYDMIVFLSAVLSCDGDSLRDDLSRHPYWNAVPLTQIRATFLVLAELGFGPELLRHSVHVLLYPEEQVRRVLDSITYVRPAEARDWSGELRGEEEQPRDPPDQDRAQRVVSFLDKCRASALSEWSDVEDSSPVVQWHHVLPLCLYLLEKHHHFSGDGVWMQDERKRVDSVAGVP